MISISIQCISVPRNKIWFDQMIGCIGKLDCYNDYVSFEMGSSILHLNINVSKTYNLLTAIIFIHIFTYIELTQYKNDKILVWSIGKGSTESMIICLLNVRFGTEYKKWPTF